MGGDIIFCVYIVYKDKVIKSWKIFQGMVRVVV